MVVRSALLAIACLSLLAGGARATPPRRSTATGAGVRLSGDANVSSVGVRREPGFVLSNRTGDTRVVELTSLASLDARGGRHPLPITGTRRFVLAPHATRSLSVAFTGQAINDGGGLSYYRFVLTVTVDGQSLSAIASNAYMCRIPVRQAPMP